MSAFSHGRSSEVVPLFLQLSSSYFRTFPVFSSICCILVVCLIFWVSFRVVPLVRDALCFFVKNARTLFCERTLRFTTFFQDELNYSLP